MRSEGLWESQGEVERRAREVYYPFFLAHPPRSRVTIFPFSLPLQTPASQAHFSNKASALCKLSIAVFTSSYCNALAAKRQYFWACSLSWGDKVDVGCVGGMTEAAGTGEGTTGWVGCNTIKVKRTQCPCQAISAGLAILKRVTHCVSHFNKIQLVVYYQCGVLIGWATTRLYVIAY